jgi:hypothetical protein
MIAAAYIFQLGAGIQGIGCNPGSVLFRMPFEIVETMIQSPTKIPFQTILGESRDQSLIVVTQIQIKRICRIMGNPLLPIPQEIDEGCRDGFIRRRDGMRTAAQTYPMVAVEFLQLIADALANASPLIKQWGINFIHKILPVNTYLNTNLVEPVDITGTLSRPTLGEHNARNNSYNYGHRLVFQDNPGSGLTFMFSTKFES